MAPFHNICTFFNCFILQLFYLSHYGTSLEKTLIITTKLIKWETFTDLKTLCRGEAGAEVTGAGGECGGAGTTAVQAGAGREKTEGQTETGASGESDAKEDREEEVGGLATNLAAERIYLMMDLIGRLFDGLKIQSRSLCEQLHCYGFTFQSITNLDKGEGYTVDEAKMDFSLFHKNTNSELR
ncbi:hypothetical protein ACJX0J_008182, partial [Zea mays]